MENQKDKIIEDLIELVETFPNDAQLGEEIRKVIRHYKQSTYTKNEF